MDLVFTAPPLLRGSTFFRVVRRSRCGSIFYASIYQAIKLTVNEWAVVAQVGVVVRKNDSDLGFF
jgi:hypothetical protein